MYKVFALILCFLLTFSCFGCDRLTPTYTTSNAGIIPPTTTHTNTTDSSSGTVPEDPDPYYQVDHAQGFVSAGSIAMLLSQGIPISVSYDQGYKGTPGFDYGSPDVYTFREYLTDGAALQWSPLTWQTAADGHILSYTSMGLYSLVPNQDLTGWSIACEMATAAPEDVTTSYVGQFGITAGDSARAFRIQLNPNAYWSNGQPINADTYLYSYQQLLDRRLENSRAAEVIQGELALAGALEYYTGTGSWEDVGIRKTGEYEIVLITRASVRQPEFSVPYYLQASYLVYAPLWESCLTYYDTQGQMLGEDSPAAVKLVSHYCTNLATSISYGPYTLTNYAPDQLIALERNFVWYGYADGKHLGQYQADAIRCHILGSYAEALQAYLAGELDVLTLNAADIDTYLDSGLVRLQPETYTTKLTFNTDRDALLARGHGILANVYFRQALSLSIDRSRFSGNFTAPGMTALGLINHTYWADVETSLAYRDTQQAQNILQTLYGSLDASGQNLELAQQLMALAYAQCLADGSYDGTSTITLTLSVYRQEDSHDPLLVLLQQALEAACAGTGFAGKVTIDLVVDSNCYAAMAQGQTDMILTTWGGNAADPYGILYSCYCSDSRLEYGFDPAAVTLQIQINGNWHTATLLDWAKWCAGIPGTAVTLEAFCNYDAESRAAIFAQLEYAYLSQYATTPLYVRSSAVLLSEKGSFALANYHSLLGFGGIRYYTFQFSDTQWNRQH